MSQEIALDNSLGRGPHRDATWVVVCHMGMEASDHDLARRAAQGSKDAAAELFTRHWSEVRRTAHAVCRRPALADEVAQAAMVQAFTGIAGYRGDGSFAGWLRRIVVTRALNARRGERRLAPLEAAGEMGVEDQPRLPDPSLADALAGLSDKQVLVLRLRYGLDLSPPEIAQALGVPVGTVNSRLGRALRQLRRTLEVPDAR